MLTTLYIFGVGTKWPVSFVSSDAQSVIHHPNRKAKQGGEFIVSIRLPIDTNKFPQFELDGPSGFHGIKRIVWSGQGKLTLK